MPDFLQELLVAPNTKAAAIGFHASKVALRPGPHLIPVKRVVVHPASLCA
jgi:hypothetical protein